MQSSQHGSHVFASFPEETTSKAERKRILGSSYSSRKDTFFFKTLAILFMGNSEKMRGDSLTASE
jgi:hypothetical protein